MHETPEQRAKREALRQKGDRKKSKKRKREEARNARAAGGGRHRGPREPLQVRVFGLAYTSTEADVRAFFADCGGTIEEFEMPLWEDSGRSKGFCGLKFSTEAAADAAVAKDGQELAGRWLRIQHGRMFSSWGVAKGEAAAAAAAASEEAAEEVAAAAAAAAAKKKGKTVFLGNLDWTMSKRGLRRACEEAYGKVTSVRMQKPTTKLTEDGQKNNNSGFAHVTFATEEIAAAAVAKNGQDLQGRKATVDWAK